jgi:hypothetical protein
MELLYFVVLRLKCFILYSMLIMFVVYICVYFSSGNRFELLSSLNRQIY